MSNTNERETGAVLMRTHRRDFLKLGTAAAAAAAFGVPAAYAQDNDGELTIAALQEVKSLDPHFFNGLAEESLAQHFFDRLANTDAQLVPRPALAESWSVIDDLTWEFKLRPDVKFHDGSPFTADDVVFTFNRAVDVPGSPNTFRNYLRGKTAEKVDDLTVRVRTEVPNALTVRELAAVPIISKLHGEKALPSDYDRGTAVIGTGPYRFVEMLPGTHVKMERYEDYWGDKPQFETVFIRPISSTASQVAGLLAGELDVIEGVPPDLVPRVKDAGKSVTDAVINRVMYIAFDQNRETTPFVTANDGSEIPNPLRDVRVRQAISLSVDLKAIADRILEGGARPAGQIVPPFILGEENSVPPITPDLDKARALLAEAGYPDGFRLTLHGPNDLFPNDFRVVQAVAQMVTRIGIDVSVDVMPTSVFRTRLRSGGPNNGPSFSAFYYSGAGRSGEALSTSMLIIHSPDKEKGMGQSNIGGYANSEVDQLLESAQSIADEAERNKVLGKAMAIAMDEVAVMPLYHPTTIWGLRGGLAYAPRADGRTMAMGVTKA